MGNKSSTPSQEDYHRTKRGSSKHLGPPSFPVSRSKSVDRRPVESPQIHLSVADYSGNLDGLNSTPSALRRSRSTGGMTLSSTEPRAQANNSGISRNPFLTVTAVDSEPPPPSYTEALTAPRLSSVATQPIRSAQAAAETTPAPNPNTTSSTNTTTSNTTSVGHTSATPQAPVPSQAPNPLQTPTPAQSTTSGRSGQSTGSNASTQSNILSNTTPQTGTSSPVIPRDTSRDSGNERDRTRIALLGSRASALNSELRMLEMRANRGEQSGRLPTPDRDRMSSLRAREARLIAELQEHEMRSRRDRHLRDPFDRTNHFNGPFGMYGGPEELGALLNMPDRLRDMMYPEADPILRQFLDLGLPPSHRRPASYSAPRRGAMPQPTNTSASGSRTQTPPVPSPMADILTQLKAKGEDVLEMLKAYDTVIIVDDSASMNKRRWTEAREALANLTELASKYDVDGIDVHFLNSPRTGTHLRTSEAVKTLFDQVKPCNGTPTGAKLEHLLRDYLFKLEKAQKKMVEQDDHSDMRRCKPVNFIVITDGAPTDDPEPVIVQAAKRLDNGNFPITQVGIQFVQIGSDESAKRALLELDDELVKTHGIRDIVDTTPYSGTALTAESIVKTLIGGINRRVDRKGASSVIN